MKGDNSMDENTLTTQENKNLKPLSDIFNEDKEYNTNMLKVVPGLKDTVVPTLGNQFFFPKQYNLNEDEIKNLNYDPSLLDEHGYIHTQITIDEKPVVFHQHVSALSEKDKSYTPYNALNFNLEGMKIIFENKIPLCFKQTVALLALYTKDPKVLALGFENEELIEVACALQQTLNLTHSEFK